MDSSLVEKAQRRAEFFNGEEIAEKAGEAEGTHGMPGAHDILVKF
jgi:hypothetical protein